MSGTSTRPPRLPPRWFVIAAWRIHRAVYRLSGGRLGLWVPKAEKWGTLRLTTIGRRSGKKRSAILGYYEDGSSLVTLAMNGWADGEPAWWLNLLANPQATVELKNGPMPVRGRAAEGAERARLWELFRGAEPYAERRTPETAVVILEPIAETP